MERLILGGRGTVAARPQELATRTIRHGARTGLAFSTPRASGSGSRAASKCLNHYLQAARIRPNSAETHYRVAKALEKMPEQIMEARGLYETALLIKPDYPEAHNDLGNLLAGAFNSKVKAIDEYQTALRFKPDFAEAHNNLGCVLSTIPGRLPDAISHFEASLRINPDFSEARENLDIAQQMLHRAQYNGRR